MKNRTKRKGTKYKQQKALMYVIWCPKKEGQVKTLSYRFKKTDKQLARYMQRKTGLGISY